MDDLNIPFQSIDWSQIPKVEHLGETGMAHSQGIQLHGLQIRIVEYSKGYLADHWCEKGHLVHCLEGEFVIEFKNSMPHTLSKGMSFVVSDDLSSHRLVVPNGAKLLVVDGDFLKKQFNQP